MLRWRNTRHRQKLADRDLEAMRSKFSRGVQSAFDSEEYGFGKREKAVLPRTFLYMLGST